MLVSKITLLSLLASHLNAQPTNELSAAYGENIYARLWRTALTGNLKEGSVDAWPHYTQGAYNNTSPSEVTPGVYVNTEASGWTSGFFPDALWQLHRRQKSLCHQPFEGAPSTDQWVVMAQAWTSPLQSNSNLTSTHDLGFLAKPFESAMQINGDNWLSVLQNMSNNLANRFEPNAGIIRSWDCNNASSSAWCSHEDSVLVIIDNMMNLALLVRSASNYTHNQTLLDIAKSHADRTIANHVRQDGSSYHVCDYSSTSGDVYLCRTAQGLADDSTWARGQAWGLYGFAELYSLTGQLPYLHASMEMADWFIEHLPADGLPFWDFDADYVPDLTPRDSSAATIAASGMLLLQEQVFASCYAGIARNYKVAAVNLLTASIKLALAGEITFSDMPPLGADTYLSTAASTAESEGFEAILLHGTSNNNPKADPKLFDIGLSYGDFYLIEAANRLLE
ncbi:uncharacterized protein HMPREF1541_02938 [Cyphellophora europaea CBS 101466]|uniref:Uncharacterized protein n=1 Tax=Cyphellophora europaea (strain CBS 101466) TaxID=1220924 RepID=W2RWY1_CYPE1|nr:uncharacterized protein HMPREF1541_02938 [Cyphellophora europaea CBS 101466]ETN41006.1 hypothetical protein HMPREF1541_02938 [Cyphellophora europaea CBS 101466]